MNAVALESRLVGKQSPRNILEQFGLAEKWPVPLEELAAKLGYSSHGFSPSRPDLTEVSGVVDHQKKTIWINSDQALHRQRFTLAHEIAHVVLHGGQAPIDYRHTMHDPGNPKEAEANQFAAELLMDRLLFARKYFDCKADVKALANYFGVSEDAARYRIKRLKLDRV